MHQVKIIGKAINVLNLVELNGEVRTTLLFQDIGSEWQDKLIVTVCSILVLILRYLIVRYLLRVDHLLVRLVTDLPSHILVRLGLNVRRQVMCHVRRVSLVAGICPLGSLGRIRI